MTTLLLDRPITTEPVDPAGSELDASVVRAFQRGDSDAVREVYRRYSGSVAAVAASVVSGRELVADVVQQTFVKAWRSSGSFDPDRPLGPWLRTIARRTAIDMARFEGRRTGVPLDETYVGATSDDEMTDRALVVGEVRAALDALPADEQAVVALSHLEGLSHPEIADRLGVPVGTIKSRSHRAHRRLAAHLRHLHSTGTATP